MAASAERQAGFTLVEMMVALALFALVSLAGLGLVQAVLGVERRLDGRLERLARLERALYLIDSDFAQAVDAPVRLGNAVSVDRNAAGGPVTVGYALAGGALMRLRGADVRPLVEGVEAADWRFYRAGRWVADPGRRGDRDPPDAVALTLALAPAAGAPGGTLRRVVALPSPP